MSPPMQCENCPRKVRTIHVCKHGKICDKCHDKLRLLGWLKIAIK